MWLFAMLLTLAACGSAVSEGTATAADPNPDGQANTDSTTAAEESVVDEESDVVEESTDADSATPLPATLPPVTVPADSPQALAEDFVCDDPCNVVIEGDSLTRGLVDRLCNQTSGLATCHNSGVSGDRTDQMLDSAPTDVDALVGPGNNDLLFLWAGTNDLWQRHHSNDVAINVEQTAQNIETYIDERRAAGWDFVVLVNLPPMMSQVQGIDELNSRIENIAADSHIDLNSDAQITLGNANGFRDPDQVHFSRPGYNYVMDTYYIPLVTELRS